MLTLLVAAHTVRYRYQSARGPCCCGLAKDGSIVGGGWAVVVARRGVPWNGLSKEPAQLRQTWGRAWVLGRCKRFHSNPRTVHPPSMTPSSRFLDGPKCDGGGMEDGMVRFNRDGRVFRFQLDISQLVRFVVLLPFPLWFLIDGIYKLTSPPQQA